MKRLLFAVVLTALPTVSHAGSKLPQALQNIYCAGTSCGKMKSDHVKWSDGRVCKFTRVNQSKDGTFVWIKCPNDRWDDLIILNSDGTISEPPGAH